MSNLLADIRGLEDRLHSLIDGVALPSAYSERMQLLLVEAIIEALSEYADLPDLDAIAEVAEVVLERIFPDWSEPIYSEITDAVSKAIKDARVFYAEQGIDLTGLADAVGRSRQIQQLTVALEDGMRTINDELREATVDILSRQILEGTVNRQQLADDILEVTKTTAYKAHIQAKAGVAAYNQTYRNGVSERAGLDYFYYDGPLQRNTRHFCRIHLNRVFSAEQVVQMDNGMLNPVHTHRGGWNCIHSWLPISLDWDDELATKLVTESNPTVVPIDKQGKRTIIVFADAPRIERLNVQIPMERRGYQQFIDSANPPGFVAIHESWFDKLGNDRRSKAYKRQIRAREAAISLADQGFVVELTTKQPGDLLIDGETFTLEDLAD